MRSTPVVPMLCPTCGYHFDHATALNGRDAPRPGDVSLCLNCAERLVFEEGLRQRVMTQAEYNELPDRLRRTLDEGKRHIKGRQMTGAVLKGMKGGRA